MTLTWHNYRVDFHSELPERERDFHRTIRAVSTADARWRVVRKYILPHDAIIINIVREDT